MSSPVKTAAPVIRKPAAPVAISSSKQDSSISSDTTADSISISTGASEDYSSSSSSSSSSFTTSSVDTEKSDLETLFVANDGDGESNYVNGVKEFDSQSETFADLLKLCGDAGCWQIRLFFLTSFCGFLTALHNLAYAFIGATPDYWCTVPSYPGLTEKQIKNLTLPIENGQFSKCRRYKVIRDGLSNGSVSVVNTSWLVSCSRYTYDHSEFETTIVTEWDLVCGQSSLATTVQGIYMLGILVGSPIFGMISDRTGRKYAVIIATGVFAVFAPVVGLVPNYIMLVISRFILGAATPGLYSTSFVLLVEGIGISWRGVAGTWFCLPFAFGYMALAGFGNYIRNWRVLQLAISAPIILQIFICFFLPKSPRWLLRKGKVAEAELVFREIAKTNGLKLPINFSQRVCLVGLLEKPVVLVVQTNSWKRNATTIFSEYIQLMRTPKLRVRTLVLYFCWLSVSMVYYGVALNAANLSTNRYMYTFLCGLLEIPSYLMVAPLIKYIGRRFTFAGFFILCGSALLLSLIFSPGSAGVVTLALIGKILIGAAYALIYLYAAELLPTLLRSSGVASACMAGHIGSAMSPYIVDELGQHNRTYPAIVFGSLAVIAGLLALLLAETRNKMLPETVEDIENPPKPEPKPKPQK